MFIPSLKLFFLPIPNKVKSFIAQYSTKTLTPSKKQGPFSPNATSTSLGGSVIMLNPWARPWYSLDPLFPLSKLL